MIRGVPAVLDVFLVLLASLLPFTAHAFVPHQSLVLTHATKHGSKWRNRNLSIWHVFDPSQVVVEDAGVAGIVLQLLSVSNTAPESTSAAEIAAWTLTFSSLHIGMSAIRNRLIHSIGNFANVQLKLVGRGWNLPNDIWPGDEAGQEIFPTAEIAGRQLYRMVYTIVSFVTLGSAFRAYLTSIHQQQPTPYQPIMLDIMGNQYSQDVILHLIAALAIGFAIGSLVNPSPLSLVPVYKTKTPDNKDKKKVNNIINVVRVDATKLQPYGLTRITRHPLILPVIPWSLATAWALGGHEREFALFGILALYSLAGCYAQDLRLVRNEGSVGTVFFVNDQKDERSMADFAQATSLIPFQAILEGRQMLVLEELPWLAIVLGSVIGYQIQQIFVDWLLGYAQ
jgi:uncharacterized membrane protein